MNILGIIPARAGSKGIKDKNIYPLCGKPLIDWTVEACLGFSNLNDFVVSTDGISIANEAYKYKYVKTENILFRQWRLSLDDTTSIDVIKDVMEEYEFKTKIIVDCVALLQPTSPLRTSDDIRIAINTFSESGKNSLYSGYYIGIKHKSKVYDKHASEKHFQRNGAIFIAKRELIEQGKLWDDDVIEFEMPLSRSIDIDTMDDMYIAEALLEKRLREVKNP